MNRDWDDALMVYVQLIVAVRETDSEGKLEMCELQVEKK